MRTLKHYLYYPSRSNNFTLWHLTDLHIGHAACDERQLQADIDAIASDPYAYWGGGGDYIDAISRKGDKRYAESSFAPWLHGKPDPIGKQVERVVGMLSPIAHKCLYLVTGNHEDAVLQYADRDVYREIVKGICNASKTNGVHREMRELAVGWEGFIQLVFRRGEVGNYGGTRTVTLYTHHGSGGGRKQGGHALRLEETLLTYECDLALVGHRHIRQIVNVRTVRPSGKGVEFHERVGVFGGSYLGAYIDEDSDGMPIGNYPQYKQLQPTTVGVVPVIIKPDIPRITPIVTNGNAGELIRLMRQPETREIPLRKAA